MTCVVAMIGKDGVYMGADSAGSNSYTYTKRKDKKLFFNGDYMIGYTTSFRMGQILMFCDLPKVTSDDRKDLFKFMVTKFIDSVRKHLKDSGYSKIESNSESGGCFLVAVDKRVFKIEDDYQVSESLDNFTSCGSGEDHAYCCMKTLSLIKSDMSTEDKLKTALTVAESIGCFVKKPFNIICNKDAGK